MEGGGGYIGNSVAEQQSKYQVSACGIHLSSEGFKSGHEN